MLNINDLENRWKRYKLLSYIPYAVISISSVVVVLVLILFTSNSDEIVKEEKAEILQQKAVETIIVTQNNDLDNGIKKDKIQVEEQKTEETTQMQAKVEKKQSSKIVLEPSMSFMKTMNRNSIPLANSSQTSTHQSSNSTPSSEYKEKVEELEEITQEKESSVKIKRDTTDKDIALVRKRFEKSNDPALSLFIAKKYYEKQDYRNSYNYSLITNEINNNIEESWMIFTKSLVKLGEKEKAIETLKQYIEYTGSSKARTLLDEIIGGKFR